MTTRRETLARLIAGGWLLNRLYALGQGGARHARKLRRSGACLRCHTHIFGAPDRFPLSPARTYTPETALPEEMSALHRALGIERVVIVTPSIYGTDNSATLYGMKARGAHARGIAVIDEKTPERDLDAMNKAGVRGIRLNLATAGPADPAVARQRFQEAADA